nr:hypothetical protein [Saprospiraceae bacterium]
MILISDCGSSLCKWSLFDNRGEKIKSWQSLGFNFSIHSEAKIMEMVYHPKWPFERSDISALWFFGAGLNSPEHLDKAYNLFSGVYSRAKVEVGSDMVLAALATAGSEKGVCCIMGTGSNSAFWNGFEMIKNTPSLGYLLGDEASGNYFGKEILRDYYYRQLPKELCEVLENRMEMDLNTVTDELYRGDKPNKFLAGVFGCLTDRLDHPYIRSIVASGLEKFFVKHIDVYGESREWPIHFSGSVAKGLEEQIRKFATTKGYVIGRIVKNPLEEINLKDLEGYGDRKKQQK